MSENRSVQLEIITPGCESKIINHPCSQDLSSLIKAVHNTREELFAHFKNVAGKENCI